MNKTTRQAILVLGMHRSGTSALAGALGLLGARLPARQMPPQPDNPKGFFESEKIAAIHDRMLAAAGTSWFGFDRIPVEWFRSAPAVSFCDELATAIREDYDDAALFVVKDPRICRLMPLWRQVLDKVGAHARFVIPLRNPLEVARSLEKRNGLPLAHGCLSWLRHMLDAEHETRGSPRVFVHYHDLLSDPVQSAARIASQLTEEALALNKGNERDIAALIDSELRHHVAEPEELHRSEAFYPWLWDAYEAFNALVERPAGKEPQRRLDRVRKLFEPAVASFGPLLTVRDTKISALDRTLSEREAKVATLSQALAEREAYIAALDQTLAERDGRITALDKALMERDSEFGVLRRAVSESATTIKSLQATIALLFASTSWRISKPIRIMRQLSDRTINRVSRLKTLTRAMPSAVARNGGVFRGSAKLRNAGRMKVFVHRMFLALAGGAGAIGAALMARIAPQVGISGLKFQLVRFGADAASGQVHPLQKEEGGPYAEWVAKYDTLNDELRAKIRDHIGRLRNKPLISIVMPIRNPHLRHLDDSIRSVRSQLYPQWELLIVEAASSDLKVRELIDQHVAQDSRIKVVGRKDNSRAINSALNLTRGEFVAFLDQDDVLSEHALYWVASELEIHPQADILYSDVDFVDDDNRRYGPYFKPDFSVELMLGHNLVSQFGLYRRSIVEAVGGMRNEFGDSQDYDLALRVLEKSAPGRVRHIPAVLYHWRRPNKTPDNFAQKIDRFVARSAVKKFLAASSIKADVAEAPAAKSWRRIRYRLPQPAPKVSVIIPTKNKGELLQTCVRGVLHDTDYPSLDVTIVDHESDDLQTKTVLRDLAEDPRVRVLPYSGPFNFSAINNFAVGKTDGEVLAFLNNDIEIMHSDWLRDMVSHVVLPGVGAVGAKLYYPDGNIQHVGIITGMGVIAGHNFWRASHDVTGPNGETILVRELSAVTGACMVVRRNAFVEAGGFNAANLAVALNDVDFCLRLRERGYRIIFTPFVELIHHESASRPSDLAPEQQERLRKECEYMMARWGGILHHDPYFNPNLSLKAEMLDLAEPPRVSYPWDAR